MDKFEYKVRAEEIKSLIAQGDYVQAAEIADSIDWRRVKSVMMLCTISDLYKINRRYEDARDMLLLAYDRHPGGRTIVYSLCELSIKMEEFVQAVEYYKEFVQIAPKDTGRYILQYKLYEAQDVGLEERIAVLEELKKRDYREKWAYELAYLYHRVGLATRCVEECDELILWFGDGKYVIKAMELKMLHQPLTVQQQQKYDYRFAPHYGEQEQEYEQLETQGQYQQSGQSQTHQFEQPKYGQSMPQYQQPEQQMYGQQLQNGQDIYVQPGYYEEAGEPVPESQPEEFDIHVKTMDVSQYNTINLQKELAEGLKEVLGEQDPITRDIIAPMIESDTESLDQLQIEEVEDENLEPEVQESEVFFGETGEIGDVDPALGTAEDEAEDEQNAVGEAVPEETIVEGALVEENEEGASDREDDQITGQLSIDDIMAEWARLKREADGEENEIQVAPVAETNIEEVEELAEIEDYEPGEEADWSEAQEQAGEYEENGVQSEEYTEDEQIEVYAEEEMQSEEYVEDEQQPEVYAKNEQQSEIFMTENTEEESQEEAPQEELAQEKENREESAPVQEEIPHVRSLTKEERELFGQFVQNRSTRQKLINVLDKISLAGYTGNVIVTGDENMDTMGLAKSIIRDVQMTDSNFSGKTAKITGTSLNQKDAAAILEQLKNGALIIQKASGINEKTAQIMYRKLQQDSMGIIVVLEDTKRNINRFLEQNKQLAECFNARMDMEALSNEALVIFGKRYAREMEYSIDDLGVLALHTRIEDMQTIDHAVTIMEVKEIVDDAIDHASRKTIKHFLDVLLGKRYDEEDMIILRENDFV